MAVGYPTVEQDIHPEDRLVHSLIRWRSSDPVPCCETVRNWLHEVNSSLQPKSAPQKRLPANRRQSKAVTVQYQLKFEAYITSMENDLAQKKEAFTLRGLRFPHRGDRGVLKCSIVS